MTLLSQLREACAEVAVRAQSVRINEPAVAAYAASLPPERTHNRDETPGSSPEDKAAFWLTLDAINFGSGWFPTFNKRSGSSGYHTIAAGIQERFQAHGPWSAQELQTLSADDLARTLSQDPDHELVKLFTRSLNDLGRHIETKGSFLAATRGSATELVERLATWECFADASTYGDIELPFLKRAQIAAADLARAGVTRPSDLNRLTMFADNLVPHVLRLDGLLDFDASLRKRIEREQLIEHNSPEEIEIRACALHAVELMTAHRGDMTAAQIDELLWLRGQEPRYKARPRHRSRCTAY